MCHPSHGQKQQCSKCHKPHGEESTRSDCFVCHKGHTPRDVKYSDSTPTNLCLECHEETGNNLLNSDTKHSGMNCVKCHPNHAQIPSCMDCHGTPHISTTTDCERCHISAHKLWGKYKGKSLNRTFRRYMQISNIFPDTGFGYKSQIIFILCIHMHMVR